MQGKTVEELFAEDVVHLRTELKWLNKRLWNPIGEDRLVLLAEEEDGHGTMRTHITEYVRGTREHGGLP